jgi:IMP cyclohydrolase
MSSKEADQRVDQPNLSQVLAANAYPGRGILCVRIGDGTVVGAYFVTGRSEASREREIRPTGTGELAVVAKSDVEFDPLRHYIAATASPEWLVFGNGAQVSSVAARLADGERPAVALDNLEHEPDGPIFTDRITAIMQRPLGGLAVFGAARRSNAARSSSNIITMTVRDLEPGEAVLLTTYRSDGQVIEGGQPFIETSCAAQSGADLLDEIWSSLNPAYRVAVIVLPVASETGSALIRNS